MASDVSVDVELAQQMVDFRPRDSNGFAQSFVPVSKNYIRQAKSHVSVGLKDCLVPLKSLVLYKASKQGPCLAVVINADDYYEGHFEPVCVIGGVNAYHIVKAVAFS